MKKKSKYTRAYSRLLIALREARKEAGMTQVEAGKKFGSHASFISKCESGERRVDVVELAQFCRLYSVSVQDLLERADIH